jgi:hypothetical protein
LLLALSLLLLDFLLLLSSMLLAVAPRIVHDLVVLTFMLVRIARRALGRCSNKWLECS